MQPTLQSPCVKVCELDAEGYCRGCWRTIDEIARWASMDLRQRQAVLDGLGERERRAQAWAPLKPSSES